MDYKSRGWQRTGGTLSQEDQRDHLWKDDRMTVCEVWMMRREQPCIDFGQSVFCAAR